MKFNINHIKSKIKEIKFDRKKAIISGIILILIICCLTLVSRIFHSFKPLDPEMIPNTEQIDYSINSPLEKQEEIPTGLKSKTVTTYTFKMENIFTFEYRKIIKNKSMTIYDQQGKLIGKTYYGPGDKYLNRRYLYKYNKNDILTEDFEYWAEGRFVYQTVYQYNKLNTLIGIMRYQAGGSLHQKIVYQHDETGRVIEKACYQADGTLAQKWNYEFDQKGNKIKQTRYSTDKKLNYQEISQYDDLTNYKIKTNRTKPNGNLIHQEIFRYNEGGIKTQWKRYLPDEILDRKDSFIYDPKGRIADIHEIWYNTPEQLYLKLVHKYNQKDLLVEKTRYKKTRFLWITIWLVPCTQVVYEYEFY